MNKKDIRRNFKESKKYHITGGTEWEPGFHPDDLYKLIKSNRILAEQKSESL